MKIKLWDVVTAVLFGGQRVTGKVESIEICARDSKYGRAVKSCDLRKHSNGTISLGCGHWCYFYQVKSIK